jgi:hypothetical protein
MTNGWGPRTPLFGIMRLPEANLFLGVVVGKARAQRRAARTLFVASVSKASILVRPAAPGRATRGSDAATGFSPDDAGMADTDAWPAG